jgi:uncharacterized membrane protein
MTQKFSGDDTQPTYTVKQEYKLPSRPRLALVRGVLWLFERWDILILVAISIFWFLPFLAPIFMYLGWESPARLIYTIYGTECHLMAQRSFFLFGKQPMYNIAELPVAITGNSTTDILALRAFVGNSELGWKVAQCNRSTFMYGAILLSSIILSRMMRRRRYVRPLRISIGVLLMIPLVIDGMTQVMSELSGGLVEGFRYTNEWLQSLTSHALPTWFYVGDTLGSFNLWVRLISAILFGVAFTWIAFPYMAQSAHKLTTDLKNKLEQIDQIKRLQDRTSS